MRHHAASFLCLFVALRKTRIDGGSLVMERCEWDQQS
jgi:hypothetical protein